MWAFLKQKWSRCWQIGGEFLLSPDPILDPLELTCMHFDSLLWLEWLIVLMQRPSLCKTTSADYRWGVNGTFFSFSMNEHPGDVGKVWTISVVFLWHTYYFIILTKEPIFAPLGRFGHLLRTLEMFYKGAYSWLRDP